MLMFAGCLRLVSHNVFVVLPNSQFHHRPCPRLTSEQCVFDATAGCLCCHIYFCLVGFHSQCRQYCCCCRFCVCRDTRRQLVVGLVLNNKIQKINLLIF